MITEKASYTLERQNIIITRFSDYAQLIKLRLSVLVVFSAMMAFLFASGGNVEWGRFVFLMIGGFLVTGASNAYNQILERDVDKKMLRTLHRPLPDNRIMLNEAVIVASSMAVAGVFILWYINPISSLLGLLALLLYTLAYTPMKRRSSFAVFVGAFPGAIPPLIGWVAAQGTLPVGAWVFFAIQFVWQFPHFWAIAWVLDDDYRKADFKMLPSRGGRDKFSAFQTMVYTMSLLPIGLLPFHFHMADIGSAVVIMICTGLFIVQAAYLYKSCSVKAASRLMFGSFIYLPVVQMALLLDKI